ncbi:SDR family oxidoreductase [Hahella sp. HN01]|uniref:SDR family oxidoreductase n=1 Tax=unclassified Hahella TaxID=2624107 RepID=UPI001C1F19EC|nr:SDR family oxidoreductase [Hahella sp. HN01]MBU6951137.1 SDR family oxidoreductase [Hahella sp. HN01]
MQLKDKTILLTGATGGIGEALALRLAKQGAALVITGRNADKLQKLQARILANGGRCRSIVADISLEAGISIVAQEAAREPKVNMLINNAGVSDFNEFEDQSPERIRTLMEANVTGPMLLTQRLLPLLRIQQGTIVNIGSTFGSIGYPGFAAYCASKFAMRGFSEALQRELADSPMQVLYVAPRATRTAINSSAVESMNAELGNHMDEPDWVAEQICAAIIRRSPRVYLGWPEKLFVRLNALFPALVAASISKQLPIIRKYLARQNA